MTIQETDLLAIGGGTAGLVSAAGASYLGANATLVEKEALGGDCLWTGCVPSKALLASARRAHAMRNAEELGLVGAAPKHAFADVMERMRAARATVAHHDDPERFRAMGVDVTFGAARFVGPDTVDVEGVGRYRSKRIVLATGALPVAPPIPGLAESGYLNHHTVFDADHLPARVAVLGAGPIGMEFAQIFSRLGAQATVVELLPRVLAREDATLAAELQILMEAEGIEFRLGSGVSRIERDGELRTLHLADGGRITVDGLFVATGRKPAIEGLELDTAAVTVERGGVVVDEGLRTSNRGVWAAGDVAGGPQFTHVADAMAKTVLRNALLPGTQKMKYDTVPRVTYTDPELAHVGLTQDEAEAMGGTTYEYDMSDLDRAIMDGEARGRVRVHADPKGQILGASILASHAGELLMPLVLAKKHRLSLAAISGTIFPYPTMVEGVKRAADAYQRQRLEGRAGTLLKKVVSWLT